MRAFVGAMARRSSRFPFPTPFRPPKRRADGRPDPAAVPATRATYFYVYYRIVADTAAARERIGALMADVEARTGIAGTLLARCDDPATWMEVYAPVARAATFRRVLAMLVKKHQVTALTPDGGRHVEQFSAPRPLAGRT